ncbi:hypothetical protein M3Y96_00328900 [Aphelenchoides besseyi]|nr:hypothetical protein M3Y96_00328900 [Aphelenchoides besseyi]
MDIENLYQLKQVLAKHQIKEIAAGNGSIDSPRFDATIDDNFFDDFPTCPSVEKLRIGCKDLSETHDLVSKITQMMPFFPNLRDLLCNFDAEHYTPEQFSLQKLVVWIRKECRKITELQKASPPIIDIASQYLFKIRKPESKKVVKELVKEILETTKFNQLHSVEHIIPEPNNNEEGVLVKQYYMLELRRMQANCIAILRFTVDLDPLTLDDDDDEPTENNDN